MWENENTSLWDGVCQTDPGSTKKVNQRGGFTAIDAYHQIHNATEAFGPVGWGWGWDVVSANPVPEGTFTVMIDLWYRPDIKKDEARRFTVFGSAKTERDPDEAAKKALTDAITKGLSYLGFNADVFMGKFDDSKYVNARREAEAAKERKEKMDQWVSGWLTTYASIGDAEGRKAKYEGQQDVIARLDDVHLKLLEQGKQDLDELLIKEQEQENA